ncbi:MAG: hypothetical protein Q9165_002783 [Trypethelium subeluteriae]
MTDKPSSRKGWTEAEEIALLIQLVAKPPNWNDFVLPEGRTLKACTEKFAQLKKKAVAPGENREEGGAALTPKTPKTPKKSPKNDTGGGKATSGKKRKAKEDEQEVETPTKGGTKRVKKEAGSTEDVDEVEI